GVLQDLLKPFAAVAHLHHTLARTVVVQQFFLRAAQHPFGQHRGPSAEIVYPSHRNLLLDPLQSPARGGGWMRCITRWLYYTPRARHAARKKRPAKRRKVTPDRTVKTVQKTNDRGCQT